MGTIKQTNIKNRTYYFYNDIIDIKNFDARLLKVDKKTCKNVGIYNIGYITSSVFCCSFGQRFIVPSKKISPVPMYTYFSQFLTIFNHKKGAIGINTYIPTPYKNFFIGINTHK